MSTFPVVVALDVGTSSARAICFDARGAQLSIAQIPYEQTTTSDGGVECDAPALLKRVETCLGEVLESVQGEVVAVAMSCFWHSLLAVDESGAPRTGVLSWADNRARAHVEVLRELLDEDECHARLGTPFHTSFWPAKLLWLRDVHPELFESPLRWMGFGEFLALKWCQNPHTSLSMASGTGLFDQNGCDYDEEMLSHLPLERTQLLPLRDAGDAMEAKPEFLARFPKLCGAKFFPALGDGACSNIGGGGFDASTFALNAGTSGAMRVVLRDFSGAPPRGLWRYRVDKTRSLVGGAISNCGNVLAWARANLQLPADWQAQIAQMQPDSHGLTVLPFLAGERAPLWNPSAHFALVGAGLHTDSLAMLRASMEGAALRFAAIAHLLQPLAPDARIVFSGGALEYVPPFGTIVCDALGRTLCASQEAEASARGAALLALEAVGLIRDVAEVGFEQGAQLSPEPRHSAIYRRALERQNALYAKLFE